MPAPADNPRHRLALTLAVLLTLGSGAMDAIGFARLGDVFTSVMTGNLVLLGVSVGSADGAFVVRLLVAFSTFVVGVMLAGWITRHDRNAGVLWPRRVTHVLSVQLVVFVAFVVGWQLEAARPEGTAQAVLLGLAALAMGLQSGAVVAIGVAGLSTTYVTGTLTGLLSTLAATRRVRWDSVAILAALVTGATVAGLLIVHAPRLAAVFPLVTLLVVLAIAWRSAVLAPDTD